jgi:beta-galactosidase
MGKIIFISAFLFLAFLCHFSNAQSKSRQVYSMDQNWSFYLGDATGAHKSDFKDKDWRKLNVPHDWSIELENDKDAPGGGNIGFFPTGIGWYRKSCDVPKFNPENKSSIEFDGGYMNSEVWVNDVYLGRYPYGYSSFSYDLSGLLKSKDNIIAVRVDNSKQPNSRWYTGSGIYRHVRLVETGKLHFEKWGVFYYTKSIENGSALLHVEVSVMNENNHSVRDVVIRTRYWIKKAMKWHSPYRPCRLMQKVLLKQNKRLR